jgi:lysyl-tRNA synthetase class 2
MMSQPLSERDVRIQKVEKMKQMGIVPFAQSYDKTHAIADIIQAYTHQELREIETIIANPLIQVSTAGRITLYRSHGKLAFVRLLDHSDQIQLMFHRDTCAIRVNGELKS